MPPRREIPVPIDDLTSRRNFLNWSALLGGATALGGGGLLLPWNSEIEKQKTAAVAGHKIFRTANTPECLHLSLIHI